MNKTNLENNSNDCNESVSPDMTPIKLKDGYKTTLLLVRHGESQGNAKREFLGHTDKDLSPLGYQQAQRCAEFLAYEKIDAVYSSDLKRAYNTALPHANMRNMTVKTSKNLREIYAGNWEGMRVEDILAINSHEFIDGWRAEFGTFRIPGGESVPELAERIYNEIKTIAEENKGRTVLVAFHAAAIRSFFGKILNIPPENLANELWFPINASVSVVYYDGEKLIPGEYSHADHLGDMGTSIKK